MEVLRTTGVTSSYTCPYKAKNEPYNANPKNTYHGDMLNIGATSSNGDFKELLKYYANNINPDFKFNQVLEQLMEKVKMFIKLKRSDAEEKNIQLYQETKLYYRYNQDVWIEGQPDIFEILPEPDENGLIARCYDLKCSTHSRYSGDEMRDKNMQTYIYPLMIMKVWGLNKCSFTYIVGDKKNGKLKRETRIRTLQECEEMTRIAIEDYLQNNLLEDYPARENKLCAFCSFGKMGDKSCPLLKAKTPKIVQTSSLEEVSAAQMEADLFS